MVPGFHYVKLIWTLSPSQHGPDPLITHLGMYRALGLQITRKNTDFLWRALKVWCWALQIVLTELYHSVPSTASLSPAPFTYRAMPFTNVAVLSKHPILLICDSEDVSVKAMYLSRLGLFLKTSRWNTTVSLHGHWRVCSPGTMHLFLPCTWLTKVERVHMESLKARLRIIFFPDGCGSL